MEQTGVAFSPIVAFGENTSKPHHVPSSRKVQTSDPILIDMVCKYQGYCADMTRTIFMGCILEEIKPVYDLVRKNQFLSIQDARDGSSIKTMAKSVENGFESSKFQTIHNLGHGIGLQTHEIPYINAKSERTLKENMVITIEPGAYIPGRYGIRIEDTVLVTKNGSIQLTNSEKGYVVI